MRRELRESSQYEAGIAPTRNKLYSNTVFPSKTRFLIVDDSESMLEEVRAALLALGFMDITTAQNGKVGLVKLQNAVESQSPINVVISDWTMPEMTGLEFLIEVRKTWPKLPFILLTSHGEVAKVSSAIEMGVSNYIIKPVSAEVLRQKLTSVHEKYFPKS